MLGNKKLKNMEIKKLHESIADIAYIAGYRRYYSGDSRIDMSEIIAWAKEFEKMNQNAIWEERNYMTEIEEFANRKIVEAREDNLLKIISV